MFLIHFDIWIESNRKKIGLDFITVCEYTTGSFGGLQKKDIAFFLFIALLSVMINYT